MGLASTNAERFRVHSEAQSFALAGPSADQQNRLELFVQAGENGRCYRQLQAGDVWGWNFRAKLAECHTWAGIDSEGTLQCLWEATEPFDLVAIGKNPIIETDAIEGPVIPGGVWRRVFMPGETILEELQAEIDGASMPAWVADNTIEHTNSTELHEHLFNGLLATDGYVYGWFYNYEEYIDRGDLSVEIKQYLTQQWLRAASQVLMNHAFPTMIPLIMDRFEIDAATGIMAEI